MHDAVAFCSAPDGVAAAESLARELAAITEPTHQPASLAAAPIASPPVVWHFVRHSEIAARLPTPHAQPAPTSVMTNRASLLDALRALTLAISNDDDHAAQPLAPRCAPKPPPPTAPTHIPLLALLAAATHSST